MSDVKRAALEYATVDGVLMSEDVAVHEAFLDGASWQLEQCIEALRGDIQAYGYHSGGFSLAIQRLKTLQAEPASKKGE